MFPKVHRAGPGLWNHLKVSNLQHMCKMFNISHCNFLSLLSFARYNNATTLLSLSLSLFPLLPPTRPSFLPSVLPSILPPFLPSFFYFFPFYPYFVRQLNSTEQSPSWEAKVTKQIKKLPAFYRTRMFITVFTTARQQHFVTRCFPLRRRVVIT